MARKNRSDSGEGNRDGEGKEADIAFFLQVTKIRKMKNVRSEIVDYSPKLDDLKQRTLKHRNKPKGSKSTDQT